MDDFIDNVGIDAKHSFEDKIVPVEEAYRRWGDRVAILGGVDMDVLGRGSEEQVRARTRQILEVCGVKGAGYCLGTGNSVANFIPLQNYLAMLDEGRRWNEEHFSGT
jgi:uroporphyrinogen decarboxylase